MPEGRARRVAGRRGKRLSGSQRILFVSYLESDARPGVASEVDVRGWRQGRLWSPRVVAVLASGRRHADGRDVAVNGGGHRRGVR